MRPKERLACRRALLLLLTLLLLCLEILLQGAQSEPLPARVVLLPLLTHFFPCLEQTLLTRPLGRHLFRVKILSLRHRALSQSYSEIPMQILSLERSRPPRPTPGDVKAPMTLDFQTSSLPLNVSLGLSVAREIRPRKTQRAYQHKKRVKRGPREIRPKSAERWLGMSWNVLCHSISSFCCHKLKCNAWMNPWLAVLGRTDSVSQSYRNLTAWVCGQMQAMALPNGKIAYHHRGVRVCQTMWCRVYGIGDKTLRRARRLLKYCNTLTERMTRPQSDVEDLVVVLLTKKFVEECETIADGIWHLQHTEDFASLSSYVASQWADSCRSLLVGPRCKPDQPPGDGLVRSVWRVWFKMVKPMRTGDFALCEICADIAQEQKKGFRTEEQAKLWRKANDLHHKVHRKCRQDSIMRMNEGKHTFQPTTVTSWTIDMARPFHLPACQRGKPAFRNKKVVRLYVGGATSYSQNLNFILTHLPD
eukprot:gb/GEZN01006274.1/.p1 GENE.gb/GEZN01006274.1/~~gb/GEZN01006274.1/.p1  ORF type:complete len:475 (-),score=13.57 gb/GEZN01006274.1/:83-1507(-)